MSVSVSNLGKAPPKASVIRRPSPPIRASMMANASVGEVLERNLLCPFQGLFGVECDLEKKERERDNPTPAPKVDPRTGLQPISETNPETGIVTIFNDPLYTAVTGKKPEPKVWQPPPLPWEKYLDEHVHEYENAPEDDDHSKEAAWYRYIHGIPLSSEDEAALKSLKGKAPMDQGDFWKWLEELKKKLGDLETVAKWVLIGGAGIVTLYVVSNALVGTSKLVREIKRKD